MSANYEAKLADMGITLPAAPAPAAKYVPFVVIGDMVYVSGQISQDAGGLIKGKLGDDMETEAGAAAARTCALGLMAQQTQGKNLGNCEIWRKPACDKNGDVRFRIIHYSRQRIDGATRTIAMHAVPENRFAQTHGADRRRLRKRPR